MPRLVRQAPLSVRIKAYLDPWDWLLWIAEELNDDVYDDWITAWGAPLGVGLNIVFILARGVSGRASTGSDDGFSEMGVQESGWFAWLAAFVAHSLTVACCANAFYTFFRRKHYRLFEQPVDVAPETPSARRVRVDSSPVSSSPLRYLQNIISDASAQSRAYPDAEREVWELSVWDPRPPNLTIFTYFSPGHLLLYYTLLPPTLSDTRPSVTVFMAIAFGALLSLQLSLLRTSFSQQTKDTALIQGQVMTEYNTKFVHPTLNRPVRDVGTQTRESSMTPRGTKTREVDVYTPTTIINRGFHTNPNPNYARHYDPHNLSSQPSTHQSPGMAGNLPRSATTPNLNTPHQNSAIFSSSRPSTSTSTSTAADFSSPLKPHHERLRERSSPLKSDGGNLGVYSHAASPLRKAASSNFLSSRSGGLEPGSGGGGGGVGMPSSPLKRSSYAASSSNGVGNGEYGAARRRETGRF